MGIIEKLLVGIIMLACVTIIVLVAVLATDALINQFF